MRWARTSVAKALFAVVLASTGVLAGSAEGSTSGMVELRGSRTSWVDLTLSRPASVDFGRSSFDGRGSYTGFYAERVDLPVSKRFGAGSAVGAVKLRDFRTPSEPGITLELGPIVDNGFNLRLDAGRYRFYLLTDAPAHVTVALSEGPRLSLRPAKVTTAVADAHRDIRTSQFRASSSTPFTLRGARTVSVSAVVVGPVRRAFVGEIGACLAATTSCGDQNGADAARPGYVLYPLGDFDFQWGVGYAPGAWRPGTYRAIQSALNATTFDYASAGAFALTLT